MRVRDALETDAGALAGMTRAPTQVMRNVIHDRTVRVAERTGSDGDAADGSDAEGMEADEGIGGDPPIVGFVGFDAEREWVHVTHLGGDRETLPRLLDEPARFARKSGLSVQMLVPETEADLREAVENFGFVQAGLGPRFEGTPTRRYLLKNGAT